MYVHNVLFSLTFYPLQISFCPSTSPLPHKSFFPFFSFCCLVIHWFYLRLSVVYLLGPRQWLPFYQNPFQPVVYQKEIGPLEPLPNQWLLLDSCSLLQAVATTVCAMLCAVAMLWSWRTFHSSLSSSFGTRFPFLMLLSLEGYAFHHHLFSAPWAQCRWMDGHQEAEVSALSFWSSCVYLCPQRVHMCTTTPGLCLI